MLNNQETSERIERYLAGEMSGPERLAFEAALQEDSALAEAFELEQALQHSLGNRQRRNLLDALNAVTEQEAGKRPAALLHWFSPIRLAAAAVAVTLAAAGVWLYLRPQDQAGSIVEQPAPASKPAPDSSGVQRPERPANQAPEPGPMASADRQAFGPNSALDPMVGTMVRGGNPDLRISAPENDAVLPLRNGKIQFALRGDAGKLAAADLRIYNNRAADFAAGKFVYQAEIPVQAGVFDWKIGLKLAPGRYYAVLSAPGDEEPLAVLRFFAGSR